MKEATILFSGLSLAVAYDCFPPFRHFEQYLRVRWLGWSSNCSDQLRELKACFIERLAEGLPQLLKLHADTLCFAPNHEAGSAFPVAFDDEVRDVRGQTMKF